MGRTIACAPLVPVRLVLVVLCSSRTGIVGTFGNTGAGALSGSTVGFSSWIGDGFFSILGCGIAVGGVVCDLRGAICLTGAGVFMVGVGISIICASMGGGSGSRSLGLPMEYANAQSIVAQIAKAAGNVHGRRRQGLSFSQSPRVRASVSMFDGDEKVLCASLTGAQHGLDGNPVRGGTISRYDDACLWTLQ